MNGFNATIENVFSKNDIRKERIRTAIRSAYKRYIQA